MKNLSFCRESERERENLKRLLSYHPYPTHNDTRAKYYLSFSFLFSPPGDFSLSSSVSQNAYLYGQLTRCSLVERVNISREK